MSKARALIEQGAFADLLVVGSRGRGPTATIIVMVTKDPQAAADGVASLIVLGAKLLDATADLLTEVV
jgi:hypothetical protein